MRLPLIEKVNGNDAIYNWCELLKTNGHYINGFVMINKHIHKILPFTKSLQSLKTIIRHGKRFMACEAVKTVTANV